MQFTQRLFHFIIFALLILSTSALPKKKKDPKDYRNKKNLKDKIRYKDKHNYALPSPDNEDDATQYFHHAWPSKRYERNFPAHLVQKFSDDFIDLPLEKSDYIGPNAKYEKLVMTSDTNYLRYEENVAACRFLEDDEIGEFGDNDGEEDGQPVFVVEITGRFRIKFWNCAARKDYFVRKDHWGSHWLAGEKSRRPFRLGSVE